MTNRPPTNDRGPIRVCKRDGSIEPFAAAKMLNCIANGLVAAGSRAPLDAALARGLTEAVLEYLAASYPDRPVPAAHIAELTELVLAETGHAAAGHAIRQHAANRARCRKRLLVAAHRPHNGRIVRQPWDKALLVKHLRRRHLLEPPVARLIAGRTEEIIFRCGLPVITSVAVREIARSELLAWGLISDVFLVRRKRRRRSDRSKREINHDP